MSATKIAPSRVSSAKEVVLEVAQLDHCRFLYELYAQREVMAAHGLRMPVSALDWRRVISGAWPGWKHVWVMRRGEILVGHVGLQDHSEIDRRAEVVFTVDPASQGRGIGKAVLLDVIRRCDGDLGIDTLLARVKEDNVRALSLLEACGFARVGRLRRYYREADGVKAQVLLQRCTVEEDGTPKSATNIVGRIANGVPHQAVALPTSKDAKTPRRAKVVDATARRGSKSKSKKSKRNKRR